jgi:hypothetical protein
MSAAIGSSTISGAAGSYMSRAALHAELARYQKQLSDCVNCPSSKTLEGKANIQELSNKIGVDQERMRQIEAAGAAADNPSALTAITAANPDTYTNSGVPVSSSSPGRGGLVNVVA